MPGFVFFNSLRELALQTTIISTQVATCSQGLLIQETLKRFPPPIFN